VQSALALINTEPRKIRPKEKRAVGFDYAWLLAANFACFSLKIFDQLLNGAEFLLQRELIHKGCGQFC